MVPTSDGCFKTKENHVKSKPVTLQTSHNKQTGTHQNTNLISPGMYRVVTQQESQTNKTKNVLSSTGMNATSSVNGQWCSDSHVVQIVLWVVDSGCSKHMTGDRSLLRNFVEKFMGTVRFGNDNFAAITGYGDYIHGNITICHIYYVEGDDLLTGGRDSNLYTISISDMAASSPICLMSKATSTKSWLWHRRLSHLNFGTINDLTKLDLVDGLPKFKYGKDHLCSACERGKSKKASHPPKLIPSDFSNWNYFLWICVVQWRVDSVNGKKFILVIGMIFLFTWLKKLLYGLMQASRADADHAGCKDDCKSTSGGLQFLGGKLVSWSSKKQDCTAMSTAEAEYVSLSACCAQVIWMRTQLLDYGFKYNRISMYCDSKSAIAISCNPVQHSKTKHIDIRYHFIKEHVERGTVEIYFVGTEYQLADLFTKALPKERFEYLVHRIGMRCMTPTQLESLTKLSS
ncbi:retrovirus-related pol polyprotein from transposon TNT 1-94 [Tanacetum coccineum]